MSAAQAPAAAGPTPALDWRRIVSSAVWTALGLFILLALLLAVRRLAGAVTAPIAGPILIPLAAGLAAASVLLRLWLLPPQLPALGRHGIRDWLVLVVPSLAKAQGETKLEAINIDLRSEYDQPSMLVIYQFTVSPKGSFSRTPFWYSARPCGSPRRGEPTNPRN